MRHLLFAALFLASCALLYQTQLRTRLGDECLYRELMCENNRNSRAPLQIEPIVQRRTGVTKEIWVPKHGARRHIRVTGKESLLLLQESRKKIEATEQLLEATLNDQEIIINARQGMLSYKNNQLQPITCDGEVKLIKGGTCGLSDHLIYDPASRVIRLFSAPPGRVLVWQTTADSLLSAQEVRIHRDPITQAELVEGIGDVRFSFDLEEKNLIQQLFESYL